MLATLLLLLAVLEGSPLHNPPAAWVARASPIHAAAAPVALATTGHPAWTASLSIAASQEITHHVYLPFVVAQEPTGCEPIPGVAYGTLARLGDVTDRPAEVHADLNLSMRGYEATSAYHGLVDIPGPADANAPQLYTLFADQRVPAFTSLYQVYDWNWDCNCRGDLLDEWDVTLAGMAVAPGEILHLPDSGYNLGFGYEARVLYATEERITLKYTLEDNVVEGYTVHVENICVEPRLLALYRERNDAGRGTLPALRGGQPFGRAVGDEMGVAIRDWGKFLDPRSRKDWWQGE